MITVFTPAYNRGKFLPKIYECLCKQTFRGFEWVVVDDGSTDETGTIVGKMKDNEDENENQNLNEIVNGDEMKIREIREIRVQNKNNTGIGGYNENCNSFPIRYFYQENGGKHRAINHGVRVAHGELFLILDSDDTLPPNSLELIDHYYQEIKDDKTFGGVCGYMAHHDGTIIGRGNDDEVLDTNSIDLRYRYHVQGDMCEVFRTEVLKEIPFPEIEGERFCSEALVWNRIAQKYQLRVFNQVVYYRDYLEGGLTDKIVKIRMESPIASMMTYAELNENLHVPFPQKVKAAINYWRFRLCARRNARFPKLSMWWNWVLPIAWIMHQRDQKIHR